MTETLSLEVCDKVDSQDTMGNRCVHAPKKIGKDFFCTKCNKKLIVKFRPIFKQKFK